MFKVELVGALAHCFGLELWTAKPTFIFGVVALATEGAMEIILFDCLVGGGDRREGRRCCCLCSRRFWIL